MKTLDLESTPGDILIFIEPNEYQHPMREKRTNGGFGMERVKKNFGFGCMCLPMNGSEVDIPETKRMVDAFLDAGFNYSIRLTATFRERARRPLP